MATKIKKISELEQITELSSSSNVVIEENGKAKRIAASNFAVGGSGTGGVSSWNDLTDKPFYEENVVLDIAWDGEIGDRVYVQSGETDYFVHVSDYVLDKELVGTTLGYTVITDGVTTEHTIVLEDEYIIPYGTVTMVGEGNLVIVPNDNTNLMGIIFPKAGIYFSKRNDGMTTTLSGEVTVVNKLDEKYVDSHDSITINLSYTYNETNDSYTIDNCDSTYSDVLNAYNNGQGIYISIPLDEQTTYRQPAKILAMGQMGMVIYFYILFTDHDGNDMQLGLSIFGDCGLQPNDTPISSGSGLPTEGVNAADMMIFNGETGAWENVSASEVVAAFAPSGLPEVTADNNGNVLTVVDGAWENVSASEVVAAFAPSGLPEVTADNNGNVLTVVDGAWAAADAPSGLPEVTADNNGNVLKVVDGTWKTGTIDIPEVDYPVTSVNGQTGDITIPNELPAITTELEGAFLRVVNGVPTWVVLENAEDGAY